MPTVRYEKAEFPDLSFTGRIGTGKSYLCNWVIRNAPAGNYRRLSFAYSLKQIETKLQISGPFDTLMYVLAVYGGIPIWKWLTFYNMLRICSKIEIEEPKPRRRLQYLGNTMRDKIDKEYWVKLALKKYKKDKAANPDVHFVCEDARYPNEIRALAEIGFVKIKLLTFNEVREKRMKASYGITSVNDPRCHAESEESCDDPRNVFDFTVLNNDDNHAVESLKDILLNYALSREFLRQALLDDKNLTK